MAETDYKQQPSSTYDELAHIPGNRGFPVLGMIPALFRDFYGTIDKQYKKYGPVSKANIGFQQGVLVLGPDIYKQILLDPERNFSNQMGYGNVMGQWFGGGLLLRDFDEHRVHRRLFQTAFKSEAMRGYVGMSNEIVARNLHSWLGKNDFRFVPHIQQLLMNIGARVFYGVDDLGDDSKKLGNAFLELLTKGMLSLVKVDMPPFKFYYGMRGKEYIETYLGSLIKQRREGHGIDFMSHLVKETKENGELFSDEEIIPHLSFLFFAAYDTTTTALSNMIMHLAQRPDLQERYRAESMALGKKQLDFDDIAQLQGIDNAFNEALRLYPSASIYMRRTIRECDLGSYKIPANTVLFLPPVFNHRMAEWWDEPAEFDPDRFATPREEHKRHSFSYIPFGGGAHKCIGMNFAAMNAKLFMHQLLLNYRFKTPPGYVAKTQTLPLPKPVKDLPLIFESINT
jgi:cytochrome P450